MKNVYDNFFDLTSTQTLQFATPAGARGYIISMEADANGNVSGSVKLYLGQATGSLAARLCSVTAGQIRTGTVSLQDGTAFTIVPTTGAVGIVHVKFTDGEQPEASYSA